MSAVNCVRPHTRTTIADLLRTTVWADGRVADKERTAMRAAEIALGVVDVAEPLETRPDRIFDMALDRFDLVERHIAYAFAAWMTLADSIQTQSESLLLRRLRRRLDLRDDDAIFLEELAHAVRTRLGEADPHFREVNTIAVCVARRHARVSGQAA